jgi:hypothetical protein
MKKNRELEARYAGFIAGLTELGRKYGVAIQSIGGVHLSEDAAGFDELTYRAGMSSGDLLPVFGQED